MSVPTGTAKMQMNIITITPAGASSGRGVEGEPGTRASSAKVAAPSPPARQIHHSPGVPYSRRSA